MIDLKTREHLVYFMQCGMMRLSKYDLKFVQNIQILTTQHKPLTVNQVKLFEKLVEKYKRQLNKHGVMDDKIKSLVWNCKIIPSEPAYTHAHIFIEDEKIYLKSPFNKNFIKALRDNKQNTFEWNKANRRYETTYSTSALKVAVDTTHQYYSDINYCPIITQLLNTICQYNDKEIWKPTLVYKNEKYYIVAINQSLYDATKDIELGNDYHTLDLLSRYGVDIHESVTNNNPELLFASSFYIEKTIDDLDDIITWIKKLGCDVTYFTGTGALTTTLKAELKEKLKKEKIQCMQGRELVAEEPIICNYAVMFELGSYSLTHTVIHNRHIKKIIKLKNSTPIDIK